MGKRLKEMESATPQKMTVQVQSWRLVSRRPVVLLFPLPFTLFPIRFATNCTGLSCEVSVITFGVAVTSRVRRMNTVEMIKVIVQANPPSMPYCRLQPCGSRVCASQQRMWREVFDAADRQSEK